MRAGATGRTDPVRYARPAASRRWHGWHHRGVGPPSQFDIADTIVVGVVVRLAEQLDWFPSIASPAVGDPNLASGPLELAASLPG
jgi:hypothetical protein